MGERGGSFWQALFQELRRLGYEEGRNLKVERYSAEGQHEIYPELAKQVVATQPDLVFSAGRLVAVIAEAAAGRVPIVGFMDDPVALGLSTSLSRPSANVTGIVGDQRPIAGKRLQMLREVRPEANHVAMLTPHQYWEAMGTTRRMYQEQGVRLTCLCVPSPAQELEYRRVFANLDHDRPDFVNVTTAGENFTHREPIVGAANEMRIPALYPERLFVESGGLISYGWDFDELFRYMVRQMGEILRGLPVSEVPFYQPTKWELAINHRTAKRLGLKIPPSILARA